MTLAGSTPLLIALVGVALLFDLLNGLHDAANSIATIVSTRVLKPRYAVIWAAFFNFIAFAVFGLHVAKTIGAGIINIHIVDDQLIFGALMGAIIGTSSLGSPACRRAVRTPWSAVCWAPAWPRWVWTRWYGRG